jgi:hypothetical protein
MSAHPADPGGAEGGADAGERLWRAIPALGRAAGDTRAIVAGAHALVVVVYHMLERGTEYADLGVDYFMKRQPAATARWLARQIEKLGYKVTLEAPARAA